ncbi:MAG: hypothetical protein ACYC99_16230 [Candidatus Geothermincolia bacterium]
MKDKETWLSPRARTMSLAAIAGLSFIAYWVLVAIALNPKLIIVHDVAGAKYGGPLTWPSRWLHLAGITPEQREWLFIFLMAAISILWILAIYLVRRDRRKSVTWVIVGGFGLFATLFVFGPTFQSQDVFSYVFIGRAMSVYHSNPYIMVPAARPHDPFYPLIGWPHSTSVYGPLFNYAAYVVTKMAGNGIWANVLGFKLLAFAAYSACLPMVYTLTRRISPGRENMALAISAWCPILVMHILGAGHNDILAVAFVLGGYLLYRKGYLLTGLAVVALAATVKVTAVLALVPLFVLYVRDRSGAPLKRLVAGGATIVAVLVALYLPLWKGMKIFANTRTMSSMYSGSSVPRLISFEYQKVLRHGGLSAVRAESIANGRVQLLFLAIMLAGAVVLLWGVRDFHSMAVSAASLVLLWLLTTTYILPWYFAVGILVVAITGWNRITGLMIGAATVFVLFRIPMSQGASGSPTLYTALPMFLILLGWPVLAVTARWQNRRSTGPARGSLELLKSAAREE